ncbi:hypothetical protein IW148_001724 [Coemansia sp. RSA 1199]|nr:hypothetical protein IW148_001724 [Coemansia sp. RSA 1199]
MHMYGSQEPPTPGMFSPSFMDAMEGAAAAVAAGMSSPPMFYNVTSPYTPGHSHHHSFSLPGAVSQGQHADIFSPGSLAGTFGSEALDHNAVSPSMSTAYRAPSGPQPRGNMDDFSAGLNISMNAAAAAAMAAAMGGSYDSNVHQRSTSSASAFSRVPQSGGDMSQLLYGSAPQAPAGLGLDISTTLASFANIPGLDHFSSAPLSLQGTIDHSRFSSVAGSFGMTVSSPVVTTSIDYAGASPAVGPARIVKSPLTMARKSRKRAATVANIRSDSQTGRHSLHAPSSTALLPGSSGSSNMAAYSGDDVLSGPAFNSQAVVRGEGSKVVMVLTSKVAQKSYGTEKRFLCPPPTILLFGDSWGVAGSGDESGDPQTTMPRISVSVPTNDGETGDSGDASSSSESRTAQLEWLTEPDAVPKPKAHVPHTAVGPVRAAREGEMVTGRFVAKQLFINDVDEKRKKVAVKVRLHDPTGQVVLNEFESRPIKVISKPSKKRQSVKNVDLCIHHGSTISLFNRLRSQTVSTKYLGATRSMSVGGPRPFWFPAGSDDSSSTSSAATTTFVARNSVWDPFIIWIVNTHLTQTEIEAFNTRVAANRTPVAGYPTPPTFALHPQCPPDFDSGGDPVDGDASGQPQPRAPIPILYNQPVILQCVSTGMCSPVLTLRKVEKGSVAVGAFYGRDASRDVLGDPVSQLHKVAFEVRVQTREELPAVTVTPAGLNTRVGSYLTCMGDVVGLNATCDGRQLTGDSAPGHARKPKDAASAGTTAWAEDVGDNAVWTMVGTDCAIYRFDYPAASDIASRAAAAAPSLALPPTPTSPRGVQDYLQGSQQPDYLQGTQQPDYLQGAQQYGFDMIFGSEPAPIDTSLTAAVCGMGLPHMVASSAPLSDPSLPEAPMFHADSDRPVPVVFKSVVQHPPTIDPSALHGMPFTPERAYVTLQGLNFTPDMVVLFDGQQSMYSEVKSPESIVCLGPLSADTEFARAPHVPTSPSASDLSNSDEPRSHRASSTDSTASSATATHSNHTVLSKPGTVKIPIYLSCNGGAGPSYKTGQFYTMHL